MRVEVALRDPANADLYLLQDMGLPRAPRRSEEQRRELFDRLTAETFDRGEEASQAESEHLRKKTDREGRKLPIAERKRVQVRFPKNLYDPLSNELGATPFRVLRGALRLGRKAPQVGRRELPPAGLESPRGPRGAEEARRA